jgi:hypothetical protein
MDAWSVARKFWLGVPLPDYGLVGRWLIYMARGRFRHDSVPALPAVKGEAPTGWIAHYLVGVAFAAILLSIWGVEWVGHPTVGPALLVGVATVAAPFVIVQPAMGLGIAASRARRPGSARVQSVVTHVVFGLGLYASGWAAHLLCSP